MKFYLSLVLILISTNTVASQMVMSLGGGHATLKKDNGTFSTPACEYSIGYYSIRNLSINYTYLSSLSNTSMTKNEGFETETQVKFSVHSLSVSAYQPVWRAIDIYGSIGMSRAEVDEQSHEVNATSSTINDGAATRSYFKAGVSTKINWDKRVKLYLNYTYQPLALDYDMQFWSAGVHYNF